MARRYTLLDEVYYEALLRLTQGLLHEELPFCLVGGGAVQAWIASLRTGGGARRLADEPTLDDSLRKTRDLDFATRTDPARMEDLSGMSHLYDRFLESRAGLRLRRSGQVDEIPTIGLEELVTTKLTRRGDKAKDLVDLSNLLVALRGSGRKLNLAVVRQLVAGRSDSLHLLDELEERSREEDE